MIKTEYTYKGRYDRIRHYSDLGCSVIREDGEKFRDAVDVYPTAHTYTEGSPPEEELVDASEIEAELEAIL